MTKKRHKWKNEVCQRCGVKREKHTFKYLMAANGIPPYDHYQYEQGYIYINEKGKTKQRPECIIKQQNKHGFITLSKQEVEASRSKAYKYVL